MTKSRNIRKQLQPGERYGEDGRLEVVGFFGEHVGVTRLYTVKCHVCANDPELFGNAEFTITSSNLKKGNAYPCGCGRNPRWTPDQYEINIDRFCETMNYEYKGFLPPWNDGLTLVGMYCKTHDVYWNHRNARCSNVGKNFCPECKTKTFKSDESACFYVLKIIGVTGDFTGFGISGTIDERMKYHRRELGKYGFQIDEAETFPMWGYEAEQLEREVIKNFERNKQEVSGFRTEATHSHLYLDVIAYAEDFMQRMADEAKVNNT